jgi:soluble lytic murein transglycosylase-like protein
MVETLVFSISALLTMNMGDAIAKPQMSMPKCSRQYLIDAERQSRSKEIAKIRNMIALLGGNPELACHFQHAAREFSIDPIFLTAVTYVESSFRPDIASNRNAKGLMQLRPIVLNVLGVTDPGDPRENVMAGAAYLRHCFDRYAAQRNSTYLVLAAYNIGPGPVEKLTKSDAAERFVKKVLKVYNRFTDIPVSAVNIHKKEMPKRQSKS